MSSPTLDPLDFAPVAPFSAHGPRDLRGVRIRIPYRTLAWTGVIAGFALLGTALPASAQRRGIYRSGARRAPLSPPPASPRVSPRSFVQGGRGMLRSGALTPGGSRAIAPGGSGGIIAPGSNGTITPGGDGGIIAPGGTLGNPVTPGGGVSIRRSHLLAAMQALLAADRVMRASVTPDVSQVNTDLAIARQNLQAVPAAKIFLGHRGTALRDTQNATTQINLTPPNPAALAMTDDAIRNVNDCLEVNP